MQKQAQQRTPQYFFVVFGDIYYREHPVDGGVYGLEEGYVRGAGVSAGDVMLLYCTGNYPEHPWEAPGLGIVTGVETGTICYRYLPLDKAVSLDTLRKTVPELHKRMFNQRGNWLFQIDVKSFRGATTGRQIDWQ
jgi:hypothetical protein